MELLIQKGMMVVVASSSVGSCGIIAVGVLLYVIFGWNPFSSATQFTVMIVQSGKVKE